MWQEAATQGKSGRCAVCRKRAAREADWAQVVKLEGACVLLIAQLKHAATASGLVAEEAKLKTRIMQRILVNDAEIRTLAEPWLEDLDRMLSGKARTLH